ncbi:MAG: LPS export ABC transporter periplasmic protein LptC [Janthinobacterium lividum]
MADRIASRFTAYLPLVGMAILAGLTYWLLQSSLKPSAAPVERKVQHTPDYFADDISVTMLAPTGVAKYRLNAQSMLHYEDDQNTHLTTPAMRSFTPGEPIITATSRRGVVNSDGSIINLYEDAKIVRAPGPADPPMEADSEHFLVLANDDVVKTEKPVKLLRGQSIATANGMIYTNTTRNMELLGQVRGSIAPSQLTGGASR